MFWELFNIRFGFPLSGTTRTDPTKSLLLYSQMFPLWQKLARRRCCSSDWSQHCLWLDPEMELNLNADKSKVYPLSWKNDSKRGPSLTIGGKQIRVNDTRRLLGFLFQHKYQTNQAIVVIKLLRNWRYCAHILGLGQGYKTNYFHALIRPTFNYAATVW